MSTSFESPKGEIPEIDPSKFDLIISLLSTFESNDLHTRNVINFRYDKSRDYVFLEIVSVHNGMRVVDCIFGYDKEKIINVCKSVLDYFEQQDVE
jgi:hypothetical protein